VCGQGRSQDGKRREEGGKRRWDKGSRITDHGSRNYYVEIRKVRFITSSSIYIRVLPREKNEIIFFNEK
jgi:hypothetical protein